MGIYAITGAGGYIGQRIIEHLDNNTNCDQILAIDLNPPSINSAKTVFYRSDIRDKGLIDFLGNYQIDCLIHLAFVVNPIHDEKKMYDINVNGTKNILSICEKLKIKHIIMASSATAYGAYKDNHEFLKEEDPIRIFPPSFSYAYHKGINEELFNEYMEKYKDVIFNIIRPCIVYGQNVDNYLSRYFKNPVIILVDGNDPPWQFVHEDDVAELTIKLLEAKIPGAFNVAPDGVIRMTEIAKLIGKPVIKLPMWLARPLAKLQWKIRYLEMPHGSLDYSAYTWTVDNSRSKSELNFSYKYNTRDTLILMLQSKGYSIKE
ncbi:MAG: NAD-dependent epimerase/dehydratase family protein [Bacillota bacterium]